MIASAPRRALDPAAKMARDLERATAKAQENEAKAKECREDFNAFRNYLLKDDAGKPLPDSAYARLLSDSMVFARKKKKHLGHMAPQGAGKSVIARAFLVWSLGLDPALSTVVISAEMTAAKKQVAQCRSLILFNQFKRVFPGVQPDTHRGEYKNEGKGLDAKGWTGSRFHFRNSPQKLDPAMEAAAAVTIGEARRVGILFADDVITRTVSESVAMSEEMFKALDQTWLHGRCSEGGWSMVAHNCWNRNDALHRLRGDKRFMHVWVGVDPDPAGPCGDCERMFVWLKDTGPDHPMLVNPEAYGAEPCALPEWFPGWDHAFTIPLPPGRESWLPETLRAKRDDPKQAAFFQRAWGLRAQTPEDLVFPGWEARAAIQATAAGLGKLGDGRDGFPSADALDRAQRYTFAGGLDLSGDTRDGTVLTILARNQQRRIFPIFHRRYRDVLEVMADIQRLWDQGVHFIRLAVENNAVQSQIVGVMKSDAAGRAYPWRHRVQGFQTGKQKMDPDIGLPSMDALIRGGEIVWPALEANNPANPKAADWRRWEREMGSITRAEVKARGKTPDSVMSFWFALSALDGIGFAGSGPGVSGGVRANPALDSALGW